MTTKEINILLALRDISIEQLALDINEDRSAVSQTVNYHRRNTRIREKIAKRLGMPLDELFDANIKCMPAKERVEANAA